MKKINASKYRYPLSDGTWFVVNEARIKARLREAEKDPNIKPSKRGDIPCLPCELGITWS